MLKHTQRKNISSASSSSSSCSSTSLVMNTTTTSNSSFSKETNQKTKTKSARPTVSFSSRAQMRLALHISNYSEEEKKATFYNKKDYSRFKNDCLSIIEIMENEDKSILLHQADDFLVPSRTVEHETSSSLSSSLLFCTRGLEYRTRKASKAVKKNRQKAINTVLRCQSLLDEEGIDISFDDNATAWVADAYGRVVAPSIVAAYAAGIADEAFVRHEQTVNSILPVICSTIQHVVGAPSSENKKINDSTSSLPSSSSLSSPSSCLMTTSISKIEEQPENKKNSALTESPSSDVRRRLLLLGMKDQKNFRLHRRVQNSAA